jgi:hypothetical protein
MSPQSPPSPQTPTGALRVRRNPNGLLSVSRDEGEPIQAQVFRCFPWSDPDRYVSLRDLDDKEVALIGTLAELDPESRAVVEEALTDASFVFDIEAVESMEAEFEINQWKVRTRQGPCTFQTRRNDYPRLMDDGSLVIQDVSKNLYRVRNLDALDRRSYRILWAFMD